MTDATDPATPPETTDPRLLSTDSLCVTEATTTL